METKKTILLLADFTKRAERAADMALQLAVNNNANILVYNCIVSIEASVVTDERRSPDIEIAMMDAKSEKNLKVLSNYLQSKLTLKQQAAVKIITKKGTGPVVDTISELVSENVIWLVVMGNHVDKSIST